MNLAFFVLAFALAGFIIAASSSFLFYKNLRRQYGQIVDLFIGEARKNAFFSDCFERIGFDKEMSLLAEEKLDRLVISFKERVPMVGVFLNGELEASLKEIAKEELLNLIPDVQTKLITRLEDKMILNHLLTQCLSKRSIPKLLLLFFRLQVPSLILGVILGALFGLTLYFYL
ncbi:MAG: hypothetical protein ACSNEK_05250 [Parachlamydiaceae bacterium]